MSDARRPLPARPAGSRTEPPTTAPNSSYAARSEARAFAEVTDLSATIASADGTIIATVARHTEPVTGRPDCSGPEQSGPEQSGLEPPLPGRGTGSTPDRETVTVISVAGDVDQDSAPLLSLALTSAINGNRRVCCDLGRVDFLGAAGVNTMLAAHHHAATNGSRFSVRGAHGIARRVLEITGISAVLIFDD